MTTQEKIRRLASLATDAPSFGRATPVACSHRKTPQFADAPPRPFVPFRVAIHQDARMLISGRRTGLNHRRSSRPSLASAVCCLLMSVSALLATSPEGEESLENLARVVAQAGNDRGLMASNASLIP